MAKLRADPVYREKEKNRRKELKEKKKEMEKIPPINTATPPTTWFKDGGEYPVVIRQTITTETEYSHGEFAPGKAFSKNTDNFIFLTAENELKRARKNIPIEKIKSFAQY